MSVYVDGIHDYGQTARDRGLPNTKWSHLMADTRDELHAFASRIGLRSEWFQDHPYRWHYDVTPGIRAKALRTGAREINFREMAAILDARHAADNKPAAEPFVIPPGTAACLSCDWKSDIQGYAVKQATEHTRETGHVTLTMPGSSRRYGAPNAGPAAPVRASQRRPAGRTGDADPTPEGGLW